MIPMKTILKSIGLYLVCLGVITAIVYVWVAFYAQKTFYLEKKQWRPAEPESQQIDPTRLAKALEYVDTRLPTARSLLLLRNGRTVVEKYYWFGGPEETDYLHALNLPLLQVLIGIAIDRQLIEGPTQPLSAFFKNSFLQTRSDGAEALTLKQLLRAQAPLHWGAGHPAYWKLFYADDRVAASLRIMARQAAETRFAKTTAAAYLLSRIIEGVSGQTIFDFADRHLFQHLGITTYAAEKNGLTRDPLIGFQLKALDLAKIGYLLARNGAWEGQRIVSAKWVHGLFADAPHAPLTDAPGGNWVSTTIGGANGFAARGDGGQYIILMPSLSMVAVTTSMSRFALPHDNGRDRLFRLVMHAASDPSVAIGTAAALEGITATDTVSSVDSRTPNVVFSTPVPQEIVAFFHQFAQDILSRDKRRIRRNYARGYKQSWDPFASPARLLGRVSPPNLEYVHITHFRMEKHRAYMRGRVKFDYRSYAGSNGIFPLENVIKLKGRWRWLGLPEKTALLDRDDYFDAELSDDQQRFVANCSGALIGESSIFGNDCFAESFQLAGGGKALLSERLGPFLEGRSRAAVHVTGVHREGAAYRVQGYIAGSALGKIRLPGDLHMVNDNGAWTWQGAVDSP